MIARLLRSPAVHFVLGGMCLFALSQVGGENEEHASATERAHLVIPISQLQLAEQQFQNAMGRDPTDEERNRIRDFVINQEVLYQHARNLEMYKEPVAERRLAQIAEFVATNPHEAEDVSERAMEAWELGLGHGDLVVRRIMIDGARRLIRGAVLVREPAEEALTRYYNENSHLFTAPEEISLTQVPFLRRVRGGDAEEDALRLLEQLRDSDVPQEQISTLGDEMQYGTHLKGMNKRELERRFGHRFARKIEELPVGSWQGPVVSKYGVHLVIVHERNPEHVAEYQEVRADVRARVRQELADRYLEIRLREIRDGFDIEIGDS